MKSPIVHCIANDIDTIATRFLEQIQPWLSGEIAEGTELQAQEYLRYVRTYLLEAVEMLNKAVDTQPDLPHCQICSDQATERLTIKGVEHWYCSTHHAQVIEQREEYGRALNDLGWE